MIPQKTNILIVDDDPLNLEMLKKRLDGLEYNIVEASDGVEAWSILQSDEHQFDAILLDRMMPNMDGMEVLKNIKQNTILKMIPVIMQTAANESHEILEGIEAGCYHYLAKPLNKEILLSVVKTAVDEYRNYRKLQDEIKQQSVSLNFLESAHFRFRTLEEGQSLIKLLAAACPAPEQAAMGLSELLINAVEHGNLCITYEEKSKLLSTQSWEQEIFHRQSLPEYSSRYVTVDLERLEDRINFTIKDQGDGFPWEEYLEISTERATDSHGRGIAMANMLSFNELEYIGKGNEVKASLYTNIN
jgi:CheY-like chemotaxis protein/anti-sigma regulatory factor (Ser/Thr protein kinase)